MNKKNHLLIVAALFTAGFFFTPTVSAAPTAAYQLVFATQPVTITVGAKLTNVVVQIRSQNGTNVPQSGTTVSLALNKGAGLLTGTTNLSTDASGKATFNNLTILQAGTGNALWASAGSLKGATSSVFTVSQGKTTVTLASSTNSLVYGQTITFTATVAPVVPATGTPSGTVTFKDGSTTLGTGTLNASGTAAFSTNKIFATTATHSITAVYGGSTNFAGSTSSALSQAVAKLALMVSGITASNKVYDAKTTATLNTNGAALVGVITGDTATLGGSAAKGTFSDKAVGTGKTVTVSGLTISGASAGNYTLTQPTRTANITARTLTVTAKGVNKVYDGTTNATVTLSDNRVSGDVLAVGYATASFTNRNVGTGKPVNVGGITLSGTDSASYLPATTTASTTASITAATLTVSGIMAANKVYDAKTTATLNTNSAALVGVITGDAVTLSIGAAKGTFSDKTIGTGKTVTVSGLTIGGTNSSNYKLTQPTTTANITARPLTVTVSGANKVYDGTTTATLTLSDNRVSGDMITVSSTTAAFADKNAGNGKTVNVSGIAISGTDSGNYALASTIAVTTANITKAILTVTANNLSRAYGAANPTLTASYTGFVNGETSPTSGVTGNPGLTTATTTSSPVSGSPFPIVAAIGSLNAVNYSFSFVNGTLTVTKADTLVNVTSGLNPACTNQNITFTAMVNPVAPSTATPTGTVQFKNNGANLGSPVALTGGQGSITLPGAAFGPGSFAITAEYSDAAGNFNSSANGVNQSITTPAPAAPCKIGITPPQSDGSVIANATGTPGQTYVLQASTDMVHWTAISTNVADANGVLSFTDPNAKNYPSRYYRGATQQQ